MFYNITNVNVVYAHSRMLLQPSGSCPQQSKPCVSLLQSVTPYYTQTRLEHNRYINTADRNSSLAGCGREHCHARHHLPAPLPRPPPRRVVTPTRAYWAVEYPCLNAHPPAALAAVGVGVCSIWQRGLVTG